MAIWDCRILAQGILEGKYRTVREIHMHAGIRIRVTLLAAKFLTIYSTERPVLIVNEVQAIKTEAYPPNIYIHIVYEFTYQ